MVYTGSYADKPVTLTLIDYDEKNFTERQLGSVEESFVFKDSKTVSWINVDGVHDIGVIEQIGKHFGLHLLILEDIVHVGQRPKMEEHDAHLYIVLKMLSYDPQIRAVESEQVSMVLGPNYLLTFQEHPGDVFEQIRQRIRIDKGRIRKMGSDYLAYALIDAIVDNYFQILEAFGEQIESLEESLLGNSGRDILHDIHRLKRELTLLRKSIWPLRELVAGLDRSETGIMKKETRIFVRDLYDHTIQIMDTIESYRDVASGLLDLYLSIVSNRMNAVMKVLTIIATIFIPLGFIAGVFGMNFENMPELKWHWAYPVGFWSLILLLGAGMFYLFRRNKWL
jgi:magnesium transporter